MSTKSLGVVAALVIALAGCGSGAGDHGEVESAAPPPAPIAADLRPLALIRATIDAKEFDNAADLVADREVALVGTVASMVPGRSLFTPAWPGVRTRENSVVVRIRVTKQVKTVLGAVVSGSAYVTLPRGLNNVDAAGTVVGRDLNPSLAALQEAIPVGTQVLVIANREELDGRGALTTISQPHAGFPAGSLLLSGLHPQQLTFSQGDAELAEWPGKTFAQLVKEVE